MVDSYNVVVVGGRCAGSATATLLARQGCSVTLVERADVLDETLSTHWVLAPGVRLLEQWGLLDAVVASGCPPIRSVMLEIADGDPSDCEGNSSGAHARLTPRTEDGAPVVTYAPRREVLDRLLLDAAVAVGVEVRTGVRALGVTRDDSGRVAGLEVEAGSESRETLRADLVVGADGRNSRVARSVGSGFERDDGTVGSTSYAYWSAETDDVARLMMADHTAVTIWPTHGDAVVVAVSSTSPPGRGDSAEEHYLRAVGDSALAGQVLTGATRLGRVRSVAGIRNYQRVASGPGWALAGDARHQKDPLAARGISDAFEDAAALASCLDTVRRRGVDPERALMRYGMLRSAATASTAALVMAQRSGAGQGASWPRLLARSLSDPDTADDIVGIMVGARSAAGLRDVMAASGPGDGEPSTAGAGRSEGVTS